MKVAVIGAGSWGTALAQLLAGRGCEVALWARKQEVVQAINAEHRNPRYLSDIVLDDGISASISLADAVDGAEAIVVVTPSAALRSQAQALAPLVGVDTPIAICTKGVEDGTGATATDVFVQELSNEERLAVLSGPNHAEEVIKGIPSATVIASTSPDTARFFQDLFATDSFRTYVSDDPTGVQFCGAFKNVIAIAVGLSYGMGLGDNTAAMLMTRGLAEMSRMVVACGGQAITCLGLAGVGDMSVTCMSQHSRNRRFGEQFARGCSLNQFTETTHMVVEGAAACRTLNAMARSRGVELPLTAGVDAVVWEGVDLQQVASALIDRPLKDEFYGIR